MLEGFDRLIAKPNVSFENKIITVDSVYLELAYLE